MNGRKNTYLDVLINTYRLMFDSNIESITIAELEKRLMRSRGSIFYYFDGKGELLKTVIDKLFFPVVDHFCFDDMDAYKSPFERLVSSIKSYDASVNASKALLNILVQADKFYPGFNKILLFKLNREKKLLAKKDVSLSETVIESAWMHGVGKLIFDAYDLSVLVNSRNR